ncbi:ABC transporter permease [Candidatus Roizmanbacteria bacterium]|nr:ABC transporter permease [Candidatus Roizmanbacteria bacterium]
MSIRRIFGMVLRYFLYFKHSFDRMSDVFYWPTIDLLLWGLTSSYFRSFISDKNHIIMMIVSGILLWIIVWRGQYEITVNLLEELWSKNLINLFVSPLKFSEWLVSVVIVGILKAVISFSFAGLVAFMLYKVKIFSLGFYLLPLSGLLIITGWWVGFLVGGLILRYGTKIQTFAWAAVMLISPFSAIYYPLSTLPAWAQKVAVFVPTSYVFEGARQVIDHGSLDWNKLLVCLAINLVYLTLALRFINSSFSKILKKGLVKVY